MTAVRRIGLLECDHVDDRLRPVTGGDHLHLFRRWLAGSGGQLELVPYDVVGGEPPGRPDECDGWLCTGSRQSVNDAAPWIRDLRRVVTDIHSAGVPFVGVCFGHQMLAQALGGRVERSARGWGAGVHRIEMVGDHQEWMRPPVDTGGLALHFMHQDQVVDLPPAATLLGRTDHCPNAMFQAGTSFGVQAHPEFTPAYTEALLRVRELRIGEATTGAALASLTERTDEPIVANWTERFYGRRAPAPLA